MQRNRGFEFVSVEQWQKDFRKFYEEHFKFISVMDYTQLRKPMRATKGSAGYDIYSPFTFDLYPGQEIKIPLGIKAYMQPGEYLKVLPRSGQGFNFYLRLANTAGVIDQDYYDNTKNEGHMWLKVRNESPYGSRNILYINEGDAVCQAIFTPFLLADGDSFEEGNQRTGGFGSTNK